MLRPRRSSLACARSRSPARLLRAARALAPGVRAAACALALGAPVLAAGLAPSLATAAPSGAPSGARAAAPRALAEIEVVAMRQRAFLLHATLPVPPGALREPFERPQLGLRLAEGSGPLVPAQLEVVSRYPDGAPDVVELLAPVESPEGTRPRDPLRFEVVGLDPEDHEPLAAAPVRSAPVRALLEGEGSILLRARDVFGNLYVAELGGRPGPWAGSRETLGSGPYRRRERVYATLACVQESGQGAPLPHLMGVHAYLSEWQGERCLGLDLRVNNGAIGGSHPRSALETPLGIVYFDALELVLPAGWSVVPDVADPFFGPARVEQGRSVVPLVRGYPDGTLHMMPAQAQFHRRLVLAPEGAQGRARALVDQEGLGFCVRDREDRHWSWSNPRTARYFPQRDLLASFDFYRQGDLHGRLAVRAREMGEYYERREALASGAKRGWYVESGVLGWAHPWFLRVAYGFGGEAIGTFEGQRVAAGASREGWLALALLHRMNACRQPEAAWNSAGEPVGYRLWLDDEGRIPFDFRTHGGVVMPAFRPTMSYGPPPNAQLAVVVERGLRPPYDQGTPFSKDGSIPDSNENLHSWQPHDDAHLVRYTKNTKALVWLGNDPLAKDDLLLSAELFHLMFHESPHVPADWSEGATLRVLAAHVAERPHQGTPVGRAHAWGIDAMCSAYSVASPAWRAANFEWFRRVGRFLLEAAQPSGLVQRMTNERLFDARYDSTQAFESLFLIHAMRCIDESVLRGVDDGLRLELEQLAVRAIDYLYFGPPFGREAAGWQPDPAHPTRFLQGPYNFIAVAPNDGSGRPVYSDSTFWGAGYLPADGLANGIETFHLWQGLSHAAQCTQESAGRGLDNRYLRRALDCWEPHADFAALVADLHAQALDPTYDNSPNWVGFLAHLQALGVR